MGWKDEIIPEDMELSGPHVWPVIIADEAADRYIFRRPELGYLVALRRMKAHRSEIGEEKEVETVRIRINRLYKTTKRKGIKGKKSISKTVRVFHHIRREDPTEDVVFFLEALRIHLRRTMKNQPLTNCSVSVVFDDTMAKKNSVLSTCSEWI